MESITFQFNGWEPVFTVALAAGLAGLAWWIYRRETAERIDVTRWALPGLRSAAVFLTVVTLAAPVLHREKTIRNLGRVFLLVDASRSMGLRDEGMSLRRKFDVMGSLGILPAGDPFLKSAREAEAALDAAGAVAQAALLERDLTQGEFEEAVAAYRKGIESISGDLARTFADREAAGAGEARAKGAEARARLLKEVRSLEEFAGKRTAQNVASRRREFEDAERERVAVASFLDEIVAGYLEAKAGDRGAETEVAKALEEFDALTRWSRLEKHLLDAEKGWLAELARRHEVELVLLREEEAETIWWRRGGGRDAGEAPTRWGALPEGAATDLAGAVREAIGEGVTDAAVVLISDGQHNAAGTPEVLARELGDLGVPLFCIGIGMERPARDVALLEVVAPGTVFLEDVAEGELVLLDAMPAGTPLRAEVRAGEVLLWEESFVATGGGERRIEFRFPAEALPAAPVGGGQTNRPYRLTAAVRETGGGGGELSVENNEDAFSIQTIADRPRVLLVDARPRWETRYVKNLFERDSRWEVNALVRPLDVASGESWPRGAAPGTFPESREELFRYDLMILGDCPPGAIDEREAGWMVEFVEARAGGLVFVDGPREEPAAMTSAKLAALLPVARAASAAVEFAGAGAGEAAPRMRLTGAGDGVTALRLAEGEGANARVWESLEAPRRVSTCEALPGSVVLAETVRGGEAEVFPALVHWRVGRGQVLYAASDEFWRWRLGAGDLYHRRFWMQVANWMSEPPFAVEGELVSIGSDELVYDPGETAEVRVRLRDRSGRFVEDAAVEAVFYRDGKRVGSFELEGDGAGGGIYRGRSASLAPGSYEIAIAAGDGAEHPERMRFEVGEARDVEMRLLHMDRDLLETMARSAKGEFFFEEDAANLAGMLEGIDRKEVLSSDLRLWSSWWWFAPIVGLLTVEWILRKRFGFV